MPSFATPLQAQLKEFALPPGKASSLDYVRGGSIVIWFLCTVLGFWWVRDFAARLDFAAQGRYYIFYAVGLCTVGICHLTLGAKKISDVSYLPPFGDFKSGALALFFISMAVLSPLSIAPLESARYGIATWGVLCVAALVWRSNPRVVRLAIVATGCVVMGYLLIVLVKNGMSYGAVGGVNRNRYCSAAFAALVCGFMTRGKLRWMIALTAISLMVMLSSRGTLLGTFIFLFVYFAQTKQLQKVIGVFFALGIVGLVIVLLARGGGGKSDPILEGVLKMSDAKRGIGSGLTGRTDRWDEGWNTFRKRPWVGYGFRTRSNDSLESKSAHSGYINLLLDTGLLGFGLLIGALTFDCLRRRKFTKTMGKFYGLSSIPPHLQPIFDVNCIAVAVYARVALLWLLDPSYLSLGTPFNNILLMLISAPVAVLTSRALASDPYFAPLPPTMAYGMQMGRAG